MTENQTDFHKHNDDVYLKILQIEQLHNRQRWTITTFFIGISFALFGFTFKGELNSSELIATRITSLIIYWFAYLLFQRFYNYVKSLRSYLHKMELEGLTSINIKSYHNSLQNSVKDKYFAANRLLLYFGILFTLAVLLIIFFSL